MSLCFIDSKIPGIIRCRLNSKILRMKRVFILELMKCSRIKSLDRQLCMGILDTRSQFIGV